jgi:amino acid adenylation domain-containing protein
MLTKAESRQILTRCIDTKTGFSSLLCTHQLFEARSAQSPDAVAVTRGGEHLCYGELNARANQLAHHLKSLGVGPDILVGLFLERSFEMIIGLLGILKAGGAYVPFDPAYPAERLGAMLEDARVRVLLTQRRLVEKLPRTDARVICLDSDWEIISSNSADNPSIEIAPDSLAYVIYTSGSTGKPKGVLIEHRSLANYIEAASEEFAIKPDDRVLQFASISFDTSAEEIFCALASGARLVLRTDSMLGSTSTFLRQCEGWQITILDLPTAYWHELTASIYAEGLSLPPSIRLVIIGGERALGERLAMWRKSVGARVRLVNTYGPTEATIVAAMSDLSKLINDTAVMEDVPVGHPVRNVQTYILDKNLLPLPAGLTGELHIGGAGLARGYLNSPALTSEKFIENPFSDGRGARLYKTGDLARYQSDGSIQIVGRTDDQVKINGFRIELGEIESALCSHNKVRAAVVLAREDKPGEKRLVAYAALEMGRQSDRPEVIGELRAFLKTKLPAYMVPSAFVLMEGLPVSPNGKIDRKSLPPPEVAMPPETICYARPRDPLERQLVEIWEEVLNVRPIGIHDNFFELGGHSLLSVRLFDQIERKLGIKAPLATLFEKTTIEHLASALLRQEATRSRSAVIEIQKGNSKPPFFFLHGDYNGGGFYCLNLARGLGEDQPFYAVQPCGLDGEEVPLTVEEMADYYLEALRAMQPQGPYLLGGYCNGGVIAFEMARRLKQEGKEIGLLVLVCAEASNARYRMLHRLTNLVSAVKRHGPEERLNCFLALRNRAVLMEGIVRYYRARLREVSEMKAGHQIAFFKEKAAKSLGEMACAVASLLRRGDGRPAPSKPDTKRRKLEDRRGQVTASYDRALLGYVPKRFSGRLTLLWPSELAPDNPNEPCTGWGKVADEVDVRPIPGGHITCITKHVHDLAGTLRTCLENAQSRAARQREANTLL